MWLPQMIGEEWPEGIVVFQTTLLCGPKCSGGFALAATPRPLGPRNCGQVSSAATPGGIVAKSSAKRLAKAFALNLESAFVCIGDARHQAVNGQGGQGIEDLGSVPNTVA